jgi:ribosomal protein S18 acetylase RimI-like enzyme
MRQRDKVKLSVRSFVADDIDPLVELCNRVIGVDLITRRDIEEDISKSEDPMNDILIAELEDEVVGYIQLIPGENENMIGPVVEGSQFSWAVSEMLLERAKKVAREKGWPYLQTSRNSRQKQMIQLLLAGGFEIQRTFWNMYIRLSPRNLHPLRARPAWLMIRGLDSEEDIIALTDIVNLIFQDVWGYGYMDVEDLKGWISRINARKDGIILAFRGDRLIGFLIMDLSPYLLYQGTAHIALLGVHPEHRRKGVGRTLVHAACEKGRERELRGIQVTVDTANETALRFYESLGFHKGYQLYFLRHDLD